MSYSTDNNRSAHYVYYVKYSSAKVPLLSESMFIKHNYDLP